MSQNPTEEHSRKLKMFAKPDQRVAQRHELGQGKE
jgi:hypothetical protein